MTKIAIVLRNADFNEGRGPMCFHLAFTNFYLAEKYVMSQSGIFGSRQKRGRTYENTVSYNGYDIKIVELIDNYDPSEAKALKEELAKKEEEVFQLKQKLKAYK